MTRKIFAFFATSFLTVALSIPAMAQEVGGTIESIDREHQQLTLTDGNVYELPEHFDYAVVTAGMDVLLLVGDADNLRVV